MKIDEYKGKIGAIIIVLALISTIASGYLLNIDKTTTESTEYEYVTDVGGLFDYDSTKQYIDYDTASNYTGYKEYTGSATTTTDTYTNTAVSGETWYKSLTYTGTLPLSSSYDFYFNNTYVHTDYDEVTYKTASMSESATVVMKSIAISSDKMTITKSDDSLIELPCTSSQIIYRSISGHDAIGSGTSTLYKLASGTYYYFKSTNKVYQLSDDTISQITSSSSGITAIGDGYRGTATGVVLIDTLTVSITVTNTQSYNRTNSYSSTALYGLTATSGRFSTVFPSWYSTNFDIMIYGDKGKFEFKHTASSSYIEMNEWDANGTQIVDKDIGDSILYVTYTDGSGWKWLFKSLQNGTTIANTQYYADTVCVNGGYNANIGFSSSNTLYQISANTTCYYKSTDTVYSFYNNVLQTGIAGATTVASGVYSKNVGTTPVFVSSLTTSYSTTVQNTTTYNNTRSSDNLTYQLGISSDKTILPSTSYRFYVGNYYLYWVGNTCHIYESGVEDTLTLTSGISITNNTITLTGTSTRYSGSHTYTVSLTTPYAYRSMDSGSILTGTTTNRITGTLYTTGSSVYGYINYAMTSTIPNLTQLSHGVSRGNVGTNMMWADSLTVTSDSYYVYDLDDLSLSGNTGITYTESLNNDNQPLANNYPVATESVAPTSSTINLATATLTGTNVIASYSSTASFDVTPYYFTKQVPAGTFVSCYAYHTGLLSTSDLKMYSVADILSNVTTTGSATATISINAKVSDWKSYTMSDTTTYPSPFYYRTIDNSAFIVTNTIGGSSSSYYTVNGSVQSLDRADINNTATTGVALTTEYMTVNLSTGEVKVYSNGTLVTTSTTTATYIAWTTNTPQPSTSNINSDYNVGSTIKTTYDTDGKLLSDGHASIDITLSGSSTTHYMTIQKGVKITDNANAVTVWSNTPYVNGEVDVVFECENPNSYYYNSLTLSTGDRIQITHSTNQHTSIQLNSEPAIDVGMWNHYLLKINAQSGDITIVPLSSFISFIDYSLSDYVYNIGNIGGGEEISKIIYAHNSNSWGISVANTSVFLDTYGAVMHNPSLNIVNYFTDIDDLRLNIYSFALYGESITINGTTYYGGKNAESIHDTGKIYIDDKSYVLSNIYLTYEDGKTSLTFADTDTTVNLGTTTTTAISMSGNWYFTTELYRGHESTTESYEWKPSHQSFNTPTICVVFILLALVMVAIAVKLLHAPMTTIDWFVVVSALIIALILAGGILK